jgi:hypothetical protein
MTTALKGNAWNLFIHIMARYTLKFSPDGGMNQYRTRPGFMLVQPAITPAPL